MTEPRLGPEAEKAMHDLLMTALENIKEGTRKMQGACLGLETIGKRSNDKRRI